ncbi:cell division protein FtsQ [Gracilibacillus salitolerans]|uniref:Cell division protein FtsQ n=1 Tax=Gracilibacillus salitolerans TaxID=2663022 RepID=A0A5Q2TLG2_9BACI|nr:cell division protein FtsQ [Gracilibacillus salitolerans]QGH35824.1 cell division protein FtsQ [Gracilibacillus salitolerans]
MTTVNKRYTLTQSQKMMVFILSMSLYGLSNMITELVPSVYFGPIEFSIEYFAFIPLTLCILFHPLYAAIGASLGEVIFGEIMLGQFGGFGELEKFIAFSLAMYVAGTFVRDPKNKWQVGTAAMLGVIIHQAISAMVDILKVWVGVEELEAVPGLVESVVVIEGFSFLNDVFFSGILFALLPTLYLVPRLYGKIEPLLGMKPRDRNDRYSLGEIIGPRLIVTGILLAAVAFFFEFLSESGINLVEWEVDFLEMFGDWFIWVSLGVALLVAVITITFMIKKKSKTNDTDQQKEKIPS